MLNNPIVSFYDNFGVKLFLNVRKTSQLTALKIARFRPPSVNWRLSARTVANIRISLISPETTVSGKHFRRWHYGERERTLFAITGITGVIPSFVFTQLSPKARQKNLVRRTMKTYFSINNILRSFKVKCFTVAGKPIRSSWRCIMIIFIHR